MQFFKLKPSAILVASALASNTVIAADDVTTDTVVVSANLYEQELKTAQNSISVVDQDSVVESGAFTVVDAIKDVPGVNVFSDGTPGVKRISLRGEGSNRALALVNGQRIDDQKNKSGVPFLINPYFIERIEVVRGPSSVLYGSDALGGLVNVITKQASDKPISAEAGMLYNSSGKGFDSFLNVTGTIKNFRYAVGGLYNDMGDMYLSNRVRLDNTSYQNKAANAKFEYDFLPNLTAGLEYEYFDVASHTSTTVDGEYSSFRANIPKWQREKIATFIEARDLNEYVAKVKASFYYQTNDKDFDSTVQTKTQIKPSDFNPSAPPIPLDTDVDVAINTINEQKVYGGNLQAEFTPSDMFYLVTGYDVRYEQVDSNNLANLKITTPSFPGFNMGINTNTYDNEYVQKTNSLYALLSTYLTDDLTLNTGIRWNHVNSDSGNSVDRGQITGIPGLPGPMPISDNTSKGERTNVRTVGSLGLVYSLNDDITLRANFAQGFRTPTIQELFLTTSTGEQQIGNPDLKPETSDNYELGLRYQDGIFDADLSLFYSYAKNYIAPVRQDATGGIASIQEQYLFENIARASSYGAELAASLDFNYVKPYASLTYLKRKYEVNNQSSYNTGTPDFSGRVGLKFEFDTSVFTYVDVYSCFASEAIDDNLSRSSYTGYYKMGGYATANISAGVKFGEQRQYHVFAGVENLFDKQYQTSELIEEPGRFFVVGAQGKF